MQSHQFLNINESRKVFGLKPLAKDCNYFDKLRNEDFVKGELIEMYVNSKDNLESEAIQRLFIKMYPKEDNQCDLIQQ